MLDKVRKLRNRATRLLSLVIQQLSFNIRRYSYSVTKNLTAMCHKSMIYLRVNSQMPVVGFPLTGDIPESGYATMFSIAPRWFKILNTVQGRAC